MANKSAMLAFRASPELAATLEAQAEAAGVSVSELLRSMADQAVAVDDEDAALAARLEANDETALADLLALNVPSLVHRYAHGCDYAGALVLRLAAVGSPDKLRELVCTLAGAVALMQRAGPDCDDLTLIAENFSNRAARMGG